MKSVRSFDPGLFYSSMYGMTILTVCTNITYRLIVTLYNSCLIVIL